MVQVRVAPGVAGYTLAECDTEAEAMEFCRWLQRERAGLVREFRAVQALEAHMAEEVARAQDRRGGVVAGEYLATPRASNHFDISNSVSCP